MPLLSSTIGCADICLCPSVPIAPFSPPLNHPCPAVHDFGFMRFDPGRLQFMKAGEIPLAPDAAAVGLDIRVVGNDSGEKVGFPSRDMDSFLGRCQRFTSPLQSCPPSLSAAVHIEWHTGAPGSGCSAL